MGLFSFLKNAGAKVFKKSLNIDPEALRAEKIDALTKAVTSLGICIDNFAVDIEDDSVTAFGQASSVADKEKVVLALGNVEGIATVDDRMSVLMTEEEVKEKATIFYTVKSGDSLSKIAKAHYGNAMKYPVIFEANKPMLSDPDKIYPGQMLRIPELTS